MPRDVTTLVPIECEACAGYGYIEIPRPYYLGHGRFHDDYEIDRCDECDGTGEAECAWCAEAVAVTRREGDPVCAECAEEDL